MKKSFEAYRSSKVKNPEGIYDCAGKFLLNNKPLQNGKRLVVEICFFPRMKNLAFLTVFVVAGLFTKAQPIDSIYFHLYSDSLKKGFFNYINVDGLTKTGKWIPLSSNEILFTADKDSALRFQGNDLFIDSAYTKETVTVRAVLKSDPKVWKETTIYIRKRGFDEPLKSNEQILEEYRKPKKNKGQ